MKNKNYHVYEALDFTLGNERDFEENYVQTLNLYNIIIGHESEFDSGDYVPTRFLDQ